MKSTARLCMLMTASLAACCLFNPNKIEADPAVPISPADVALPQDNTKAIPQEGKEGWVKITASSRTNKDDAGQVRKAKYVKVFLKTKKGEQAPKERINITRIGYYKKGTGEYVEVDATNVGHSQKQDEVQCDIPDDADMGKPIFVKVQTETKDEKHIPIIPENPVDKDYKYLSSDGNALLSVDHGGGAVCFVDGEDDVTLLELAAGVGLSAEDYNEPDLMFWCGDKIEPGVLLFCPLGEFGFGSLPETMHVFDEDGVNLVASGDIELGDTYITPRGDVAIPIITVQESMPAFGMIVRGVEVAMDDNADANSVHCYTTGGTSLRFLEGDTCAIAQGTRVLNNWELLNWSANYALGNVTATLVEEETRTIGAPFTFVVSGDDNSGYLDGLVIEGGANNAIKNGKIIVRPISGWQFQNVDGSSDTKLYLLNADTGEDLYNEEISASIGWNSHGDLVISLNDIESHCADIRVKVVITGLLVGYTVPVSWGIGYKLECYGTSLRSPMRLPSTIIEGQSPEVSLEAGSLAQNAIEVTEWTPVAISE